MACTPQLQQRYRELLRERDLNEENYETYLRNFEAARVSAEMDRQKIANISLIQKASVPDKPVSPHVLLNLIVGALLGLALAVGLAFAIDSLKSDPV